MANNWTNTSRDREEDAPVPPLTKCTAVKDFTGEQPNDLPFACGEVLTILEPCNVVYWYLAENAVGKRGVIPITYVKVHAKNHTVPAQKRLPPPPPSDTPSPEATPSSAKPLPPLPPKPEASAQQALPLPPKPSPSSSPTTKNKTYRTFPRLAHKDHSSTVPHKPVTRVHSNEFRKAQPPLHSSLSRVRSNEFRSAQTPHQTPLVHSITASKPDRSHRHSQPCSPPPPSHNQDIPPPLPSPRSKLKAVPTPIAPRLLHQNSLTSLSSSLPHTGALGPPVSAHRPSGPQARQLPGIPQARQLPEIPGSSGDPLDIDRRPPAQLPSDAGSKRTSNYYSKAVKNTKYRDQKDFMERSGWFTPGLERVLCRMMYSDNIGSLTSVTTGVFIFTHKRQRTKRFVGKSRTCHHDLVQMFHRLYERKEDKLSTLEKEIKYNSPDADEWSFRIYSVNNPDCVEMEANKRIILNNTLYPNGLNTEFRFSSKESFYQFAEVYAKIMREKATKTVNPIRAAQNQPV